MGTVSQIRSIIQPKSTSIVTTQVVGFRDLHRAYRGGAVTAQTFRGNVVKTIYDGKPVLS